MDFNQFFSSWDTADSYAALAITLIGFLFGLLIGYLLRGPRVRRLRKELEKTKKQLAEARQELGLMKDQLDQKEAEVQRVNFDLVEMTGRVDVLEEEKAKLLKEVFHTNQEIEKQQGIARSYLTTIEDLNTQIAQIEKDHKKVEESPAVLVEPDEDQASETTFAVAASPSVEDEPGEDTYKRMERFEAKLAALELENKALKAQMQQLQPGETANHSKSAGVDSRSLIFEIDDIEEEPELEISPDKKVLHEKIIVADIEKDDLTKIEGLGPFLQTKLHEMGIYTYAQIAQWDTDRIAEITQKIGYFPGRIEKDDWVGQANHLYQVKQANPEASSSVMEHSDDLKLVEGIGPKIEQLLKDADIQTWHDLAETELERLQAILADAGERYRIHDPGTWAQQARLAAEGKWEALKALQEELKGGRKV